jgi:hypothetical protein
MPRFVEGLRRQEPQRFNGRFGVSYSGKGGEPLPAILSHGPQHVAEFELRPNGFAAKNGDDECRWAML